MQLDGAHYCLLVSAIRMDVLQVCLVDDEEPNMFSTGRRTNCKVPLSGFAMGLQPGCSQNSP